MSVDLAAPVILVKGSDEVLLRDGVTNLVRELVGTGDRSLMVEELTIDSYLSADDADPSPAVVIDGAQTPPFLTERRVVLARHFGTFSTKDAVASLVTYLENPLPSTSLVLVWEKDPRPNRSARTAAVPKSLLDAITGAGGVVLDTSPGTGKAQTAWVDEHLATSSLVFDAGSKRLLGDRIGSEVGRLPGLIATLEGAFGPGTRVSASDIEPYLGEAGDVAPWDLTDAIDEGDVTRSLDLLARMLGGGARHPLQVMAVLTNHYLRMARVDDPDIRNEKAAAEALGIKGSTFPAKKALSGAQRLGSDRLAEFTELLAEADLDLHGTKAWPAELVVEVLVARLAGRNRSARTGRR